MNQLQAAKLRALDTPWSQLTEDEQALLLGNKRWRMNNLYYVRDEKGHKVRFRMKPFQLWLLQNMWYLSLILKARQMGFTTFIDLYILDECLFNSGVEAGIIAHTLPDASKIFRRKIKFPYDNLPTEIKQSVYPTTNSVTELILSNGSTLTVSASFRSATCQYLHISEYGKICAKFPHRAEEINTGALEAVAAGQIVFIESTAEGRGGDFFDKCAKARKLADAGKQLTKMDYKFLFFPWWQEKRYTLEEHHLVTITSEMAEYFDDLKRRYLINLTPGQKAWYVKKFEEKGELMWREYPSHPDEAFAAAVEGAYWAKEIQILRQKRRITLVPHDPALPVHTGWDLGRHDTNPIWFFQEHGGQYRFIDFHEQNGESLAFYVRLLREKKQKQGYNYGYHYLPHDIEVTDMSQENNLSRKQVLESLGMVNIVTVKREQDLNAMEGVHSARMILPMCWFDESKTEAGLKSLENYRKEWDDNLGTYRNRPLHDWSSHAASAFIQIARGHQRMVEYSQGDVEPESEEVY